jgi:thioredoxin domain-containing protein 10
MSTKKYAVVAVVEESKIGSLSPEMEQFRDMVQDVVRRNWERYHDFFQFGWTGSPELANSVAMETLSLPNLLVVNTTSYQHHLPDDDPMQLTPEAIQIFLDDVLAGSAPVYGGSTYSVR